MPKNKSTQTTSKTSQIPPPVHPCILGEAVLQFCCEREGEGEEDIWGKDNCPGMKTGGNWGMGAEGEIVKAHLAKGGERERNGARTESEGGRVGSVAQKVGYMAEAGAG